MSNAAGLDLWQFRLQAGGGRQIAGMGLETGPGLPVIELQDSRGTKAGLLLGHPIDLAAQTFLSDSWAAPASAIEPEEFAETVFRALAGRFVMILDLPGARRLYPDAAAQVPCVFDNTSRLAGSTAHAVFTPDEYDARFDAAFYSRMGIESSGWFPAGLTAHRDLSRVLPNHFLDLENWTVERHWFPPATPLPPDAAVHEIVETVQSQTEAIRNSGRRVAQALTAGRETRMLLGIGGAKSEATDFVTITGDGQYSIDTVVARHIAQKYALSHKELPQVRASSDARDLYLRRGGHCVADANSWFFPSVVPLAGNHVYVGGAGGEVGRGFFWKPNDRLDSVLDADALLSRFGLPADERLLSLLEGWLARLGGQSTLEVLDLAYLEQRVGPWGSAQFCSDPTLLRLAPMLSRRGIEAMLSLPDSWKRDEGMGKEVLAATWPALEEIPYNSAGPVRDAMSKMQRLARDPSLLLKAIRKRR